MKFTTILISLAFTLSTPITAQSKDFSEGDNSVACGYAKTVTTPGKKPGESGYIRNRPIPIYEKIGAQTPKQIINDNRHIAFLAIEKRGEWLKVKAAGMNNPLFSEGEFIGYVKEADLEWGALHNCS